jgi:predicted Zn-ribbon and HTH transcriptional regulator
MVICQLKCQICGTEFEREIFDDDNPRERERPGTPVRCPKCKSAEVEKVRLLRRTNPR